MTKAFTTTTFLLAAEQQLVDATTAEAADLAGRKVKLLCND